MKKFIKIEFDEKGEPRMGAAKNTPSMSFAVGGWTPAAPEPDGHGLKSISISPALTTTPALETVYPIYWEDLTDEEKQDGVTIALASDDIQEGEEYTITITPTADWYAYGDSEGAKGEPTTATATAVERGGMVGVSYEVYVYEEDSPDAPQIKVVVVIFKEGQ